MEILLKPNVVFEVGVGSECKSMKYWDMGSECYLFEPNPETFEILRKIVEHEKRKNIHIYNVGLSDKEEDGVLCLNGDCSFIDGVDSPVVQNKSKSNFSKIKIQLKKLSSFDPGNIDLLMIDVEGSEWKVLKTLVSQPPVIKLETHDIRDGQKYYINPNMKEINAFMYINDYYLMEETVSDTFYVKNYLSFIINSRHSLFIL